MRLYLSTQAIARVSARRPWITIGIWVLVFLISGFLTSTLLADGLTTEFTFTSKPEAQRAVDLTEEIRGPTGTNEVVIVRSETLTVDDPAFEQVVQGLSEDISALGPNVIKEGTLTSYYLSRDESLVSNDRHTTILPFSMAGEFDDASDNIDKVINIVDEARKQTQLDILITGQATVGQDFQEVSEEDLFTGEVFGVPIALIILVLVFGAVVAAFIPLILAAVSIIVALGVSALVGQAFQLSFFVTNMITMIGLAVGIDYSLFVVARYREERARGLEKMQAIERAGATANRTVVFSGTTVVLALIGLMLLPFNVYIALGLGAIFVVIASVLAALTLLPAILSLLGDGVNKLAIPWIGRLQARYDETQHGGFWDLVSHTVMRRPALSLLWAGGLLIAATIPVFDLNIGFAGVSTMPDGIRSKEGFLILDQQFSAGEVTPAEIVVDGDIDSPPVQTAIERLRDAMAADPAFSVPRPLEINTDGTLGLLTVPVAGDSTSQESQDAIKRLREQYIPAAFEDTPARVYVDGETAYNLDFFNLIRQRAPILLAFVLGISFLLLMLVFRSLIVPAKAVLLNLLSVGATLGIVVLIFQKGVAHELLGFQQSDIVEAWIPLFLFAVLFGLSMDYHVFLLSRIRERYDQTGDNTEAVAFGIRSTGRLITGAALIMVAVFWAFAAGDLVGLQQMGFGLGLAVLLDASIVRMILVPAAMKLLGDWNWYLPRALRWLPDMRVETAKSS